MSSVYQDGTTPLDAAHMNALQQKVEKGLANGYASLDSGIKVPVAQLPAGTANGVASLDATTKVPAAQIPTLPGSGITGGVGMQQIADNLLAANANTFDFLSIPQTYAHLKLILTGIGTDPAANVIIAMRFNNDSAANYGSQRLYGNVAVAGAVENVAATFAYAGGFPAAGAATALYPGLIEVLIPNYAQGTFRKQWHSMSSWSEGATTGKFMVEARAGAYSQITAISRITLLPSTNLFLAGSRATLYGLS